MFRGIRALLGLNGRQLNIETTANVVQRAYPEHERPEIVRMVPDDALLVLDVGCATGALGAALKRLLPAVSVIGIERDQSAASVARQRLDEVLCLDLNGLTRDQIPGHYDAIICADVIEHLLDPERLLRILADRVAPGGLLILSVPNVRHWSVLAPLLVEDLFTYTDEGLLDRTHLHLFTRTELIRMLGRAGWRHVDLGAVEIPMPAHLEGLVGLAESLGAEPSETRSLMNAFQFIVSAVRAD